MKLKKVKNEGFFCSLDLERIVYFEDSCKPSFMRSDTQKLLVVSKRTQLKREHKISYFDFLKPFFMKFSVFFTSDN